MFSNPDKEIKRQLDEKLSANPRLSDTNYYIKFFSESNASNEVVTKVRNVFSERLDHDLSALSADDDFSTDYSIIWDLDSLADVEIILDLEKAFSIELSDAEAEAMTTIRKVVEIVTNKKMQNNTQ